MHVLERTFKTNQEVPSPDNGWQLFSRLSLGYYGNTMMMESSPEDIMPVGQTYYLCVAPDYFCEGFLHPLAKQSEYKYILLLILCKYCASLCRVWG